MDQGSRSAGGAVEDARFVPHPRAVAQRYRALGLWQGKSLWTIVADQAERRPGAVALVDRTRSSTYGQLVSRAEALARGLVAEGVQPGDAVLIQLPNSVAMVELYMALLRIGARPVATQLAHRCHELSHFASRTEAVLHVVPDDLRACDYGALFADVQARSPRLRGLLRMAELDALGRDRGELPPEPRADRIALFQLSGGSTDVPKLIARTHDDYLYSVRASVAACGFDSRTVYLAVLPIAHNFPLSSPGVLGALLVGGRVVCVESPQPAATFPWIARERVTVTALVPALVPTWLSAAGRRTEDLSSLSLLQVGGAKLHEPLARRVPSELGCRLQQVFGMAEGLVCYTHPDADIGRVARSQGRPMSPFDELRVVDDQDRDVPDGVVGHLLTRGPYTIRGYYDAAEHNRAAFTGDGYYRTGDMVMRNATGELVVAGRHKDQINRAGEKIAAPEVEALLCRHPEVEVAALVGVPDRYLGERSIAFLVASPELTAQAVRRHLRASGVADYKLPDRVVVRDSLPRTPVGKIDKRALRAEASGTPESERAVAPGTVASEERSP